MLDDFAPAQFFEMSDEARLASPSFEPMQAGMRIGSPEFAFGFAQRVESALEYETRIVDRKAATAPPPPQVRLPPERGAAAAARPARRRRAQRPAPGTRGAREAVRQDRAGALDGGGR